MSNIYIKDGDLFIPVSSESLNASSILPTGIYSVINTFKGYRLKTVDNFTIPSKTYGNINKLATRIIQTYNDRPGSTGVLLTGIKGSGKTLLAKYISNMGLSEDVITIIINEAFTGEDFNTLIQSINQPSIIIFDEFEKVYEDYEQQQMLTLFDGVYSQKKLFIVTCNECSGVNRHMINRPGRMYYNIHFGGIDRNFARDYCTDKLKNLNNIEYVVDYVNTHTDFSFDMLQSLVEEMNRYDETVEEVIKILNVRVGGDIDE